MTPPDLLHGHDLLLDRAGALLGPVQLSDGVQLGDEALVLAEQTRHLEQSPSVAAIRSFRPVQWAPAKSTACISFHSEESCFHNVFLRLNLDV